MIATEQGTTGRDRGQTLPDFALGIAIFLVSVLVVSTIVPQLLLPYEGQDRVVVTDRFVTELATDELVDPRPVGQLNETKTRAFFGQSEDEIRDAFGIPSWHRLNITLRAGPSYVEESRILCAEDPNSTTWISATCDDDADNFAVGASPPTVSDDVISARVTLFTSDRLVVLDVRGW